MPKPKLTTLERFRVNETVTTLVTQAVAYGRENGVSLRDLVIDVLDGLELAGIVIDWDNKKQERYMATFRTKPIPAPQHSKAPQ